MLIPSLGGAHPLFGAVAEGGGWLYNLLTQAGVSDETAKTVTDLIVRPVAVLLVILVAVILAHWGSKAVRRILQQIADQAAARWDPNGPVPGCRPCRRLRPTCGASSCS